MGMYMYIKRGTYEYQKRHICIAKEAQMYIKRGTYGYPMQHTCSSQ
jgi:hypothetical protein